jgi:hypothetical protein
MVLAGVMAVFALLSVSPAPTVHAAGASLSHPSVNCSAGSTAVVAFQWQQVTGATVQFLDLSVQDGGFGKDTFAGTQVTGGSFTWGGLQAGAVHWWRVNTNVGGQWQPSATGTFVPCGNPQALTTNATCAGADAANVDFFWAPMAGPNGIQYLDISQDQAFSAGFQGAGPLQSGVNSYKWANVKANQTWYYRVNQRQNDGTWKASPIKTFSARCGAGGTASTNGGGTLAARSDVTINPNMYGSSDRLYIPGVRTGDRCNTSAPVNVRDVPLDAKLGDPSNDCDVVRYDFKAFPGYGGYPGEGGATVLAGHVDYSLRREGQSGAVLGVGSGWSGMGGGQEIHYIRGDGKTIKYKVQWVRNTAVGSDFDYGSIARQSNQETLALITCGGTFSAGEYDQRWVVFAIRSE